MQIKIFQRRGLNNSERGQELVEFALAVMFIVALFMATFDLGRAVYANGVLQGAAQAGARYGIANPNDEDGIRAAARAKLVGLDPLATNIVVRRSSDQKYIDVQVTYAFQLVTPVPSALWSSSNPSVQGALSLSGQARMRI